MRIDKYIWSIRLFKTRSLAAHACDNEKVKLNGLEAKPSKDVKVGDTISVKETPIWRAFKVIDLPKSRLGAKLLPAYCMEITDPTDLEELNRIRLMNKENRESGIYGRPTKKDRRNLDRFKTD